MNEDLGNIDLDRTDLVAGPAQRRGIGQRVAIVKAAISRLMQLRRENRADWSGVDRSIGVSASLTVNRTGIETRSATNALQRLLRLSIVQDRTAPVIKQDDVKLLRAIAGVHAGPDRVIRVHAL